VVWPPGSRDRARQAAKVLHLSSGRPHALQRTGRGAIAGRLRHPHDEVVGLCRTRASRPGVTWQRRSTGSPERAGTLVPEAVVASLELVDALAGAAAIGLVHGDVRPGNVLISGSGAQLYDFGVGRLASDRAPLRPGETAPERIDGGEVSSASDVYGLGVVLFHALHGRLRSRARPPGR
jgi:hypothetical protein